MELEMNINLLSVESKEKAITLQDGYIANLRFDLVYKRWYYDLYKDGSLIYAGMSLTPDSCSLLGIHDYCLGLVDRVPKDQDYEPYVELGSKLGLLEVDDR